MSDSTPHRFPVRVYYEDTDAAGIVYYANYLRYAERARTEMMRVAGFASSDMMASDGLALGVRHCEVDYLRPARLDDGLEVETTVTRVGGASVNMRQDVIRGTETLVRMDLKLGCITLDGRPARLPNGVRDVLQRHVT